MALKAKCRIQDFLEMHGDLRRIKPPPRLVRLMTFNDLSRLHAEVILAEEEGEGGERKALI